MRPFRLKFTAPRDFDDSVYKKYGNYFVMDNMKPDVWVCDPSAMFIIGARELKRYPGLKILATPSTGTNHIDLDECAKRKVKVISLLDDRKGLETISASSEFTFKLILDALRMRPARELQGKTVGFVGYGRIGQKVARMCAACDVGRVITYDPALSSEYRCDSLEGLFKESDVVVVSCTLNAETKGMITKELIESMKKGAALVNTSRGEVIDEDGLFEVMVKRTDLRVALDVLVNEVHGCAEPIRLQKLGALITPHIAGATYDSRTKAAEIILGLLVKELKLDPVR